MDYLKMYITLIFIVKITFLVLSVYDVHLKRKQPNSAKEKSIHTSKNIFEFIFKILMAILLIYLFNPHYKKEVKLDYETKLLIFIFGFVYIFSANWELFVQEIESKNHRRLR